MGTNYYIRTAEGEFCPTCGHQSSEEARIHIGKASAGWKFCFNATVHKSFDAWLSVLMKNADNLYDEYGQKQDIALFLDRIKQHADGTTLKEHYKDPYYGFYEITDEMEWDDGVYRYYAADFC